MLEGSDLAWFNWCMRGGLIDGWDDFIQKFKIRFALLNGLDYICFKKTSEKARDTDESKESSEESHIKKDDYSGFDIIGVDDGAIDENDGTTIQSDEPSYNSDSTPHELYVLLNHLAGVAITECAVLASIVKMADANNKQVGNLISFDDTIKLFDIVDVVTMEHLVSPRAATYATCPFSYFRHLVA
ncbi:unnamed protein product [Cuscuta campestris]|uniref:Uncharacterized protein n=1 Tax=Cuscuta campestris TaxID=132261 RepID=A0A484N4Q2_9ASTE|nr:unnamed protein product [Cuscuta campestris]